MNIKKLTVVLGALIPAVFLFYPTSFLSLTACAVPTQHYNRRPVYDNLFSFPRFDIPPAEKPASADLTAVIIIPEYKDTYTQQYAGGAQVSSGGTMTADMLKVFKSFAGSVGEDIEAQLVAKGMTTKGPLTMAEVTYPDKKGADLTVSTNVIFDIHYTNPRYLRSDYFEGGERAKVYSGIMTVGLKVYYYMLEPLSEEKMWIKKLDLGVQDYTYEYGVGEERYQSGYDECAGPIYSYRETNTYIYDQRAKIFSDILKDSYPQVMSTAWNYLDTDEMLHLKTKAMEIRERKRY
jgi:hypothetical protein